MKGISSNIQAHFTVTVVENSVATGTFPISIYRAPGQIGIFL